jgi:hypothetical protein
MDKRRWVTYGLLSGVVVMAAWAASARPAVRQPPLVSHDPDPTPTSKNPAMVQIPKAPPRVELVFALDTTGSMGGLLDGAKRKIWSIAQFIANGQPKPDLRVGLVAYRDIGDEYVTRFYDLSGDLDEVFEHLSSFEAAGGGDTPEHVSKALSDAVLRTSWTRDQGTLKQVYLVGDAPPHTDYHDGFDYLKIAKKAHEMGIHINTIRCGADESTAMVWNQIASSAAGEYASIDQSGGVRVAATPYDTKLAELNARLIDSTIRYGAGRVAAERRAHAAKAMAPAAASDRAGYFATRDDSAEDMKLLQPRLGGVAPSELPTEMQAMSDDERETYVKKKAEERGKVKAEISALAKQRNEWLRTKGGGAKKDSFDAKVEGALKEQAKSVGLAL